MAALAAARGGWRSWHQRQRNMAARQRQLMARWRWRGIAQLMAPA